jgi:hypothetical protein
MRNIALQITLASCFSIIAALGLSAERQRIVVAELGPQVGEAVPDFKLTDQFGETQTLDSVSGPNGLMLLFHRSADW